MAKNFTDWLLEKTNENSAVGDLARDASNDTNLPHKNSGYPNWRSHLKKNHACKGALNTLEIAWKQYKAEAA